MPRHKPKASEDAMDDAYSEPDEEETPSTGYIGAHESTPFEPYDALPDVGMALPSPLEVHVGPAMQVSTMPPAWRAPEAEADGAPTVVPGEAPRIVHSEPPPPPEPPPLADGPEPPTVPAAVDLSSPAVMDRLQRLAMRIRDDATFARNLRVRLAIMQSNDQGELTDLLDVIRGE